jgi:beta-phosphoglucomutase-like phosphatase (HAD superfamily)
MARLRAVLFDIDGTLLDSNDAHAYAWLDSLRGHGKSVPFDLVRSKIGMGSARLLAEVAQIDHDSVEGRSITERRGAILKGYYLPDLGAFEGARTLVTRLKSRGLSCAAVSSSSTTDEMNALLRVACVADLIECVVSSDDHRSEPDRDLIEIALTKIGVSADEAVIIGDTRSDIEAGACAGVPVIALRCGGSNDRQLRDAIAISRDRSTIRTCDRTGQATSTACVFQLRSLRGHLNAKRDDS